MNIDIKQALADAQQVVLPWDLSITLAGATYAVRPLTVADLAKIQQMERMSDDEGFDVLEGLFVPPGPGLRARHEAGQIGNAELIAIATVAATYFQRKNSEAIARQVQRAMAKQMDR